MTLQWIFNTFDDDGDASVRYYLVCKESERVYAIVHVPRKQGIVYQTDLRCEGEDRSYLSLSAAQGYCEAAVMVHIAKEETRELRKLQRSVRTRVKVK